MYNTFESHGIDFRSHHEYASPDLFVGLSLTVKNPSDLERLNNMPGVKAVRAVEQFAMPHSPIIVSHSKSISMLTALDADPNSEPASDIVHALTGVDKLHDEGITGKGIKIAIIDTGVDYNHPALGAGFGPGHKIAGGFDFTGDNLEKMKPDEDPMDCNGHGTHVAGIIGANMDDSPFKLQGVAYEAELYAYRVGGCADSVDEDATIAALLRADKDGYDVINLSVGATSGWSAGRSWTIVANRIAEKGRILTISAGNEGEYGSWHGSSPAAADGVIAVGSVESPVIPLQAVTVGGDVKHDPIIYYDLLPLTNNTDNPLPVYVITADMDYGCTPLPKATPNLVDYVVLVKVVNKCRRPRQMKNIMAKGAKLALVWNKSEFNNLADDGVDIPVALIPNADGSFLEQQFLANKTITLTFPKGGAVAIHEKDDGNLMSPFSSYGPTYDFRFKPSLSAHGGSIVSTVPLDQGAYGLKSGTSMSAPYMAGCAALLLQARGRSIEVARQARDLFETTSIPILSDGSANAILQTATVAGAGVVDAYSAVRTETLVYPGELLLNDTQHFKGTHEFTVKNVGIRDKTYSIDHFPAGTAITIQSGTSQASLGPVPLAEAYASVQLSEVTFRLKPNESKTISAEFTPPSGLDSKTLPVYSGFLQVGDDGDDEIGLLHVSYMGVVGFLYDQPVLDVTDEYQKGFTLPAIVTGEEEQENSYTVQSQAQTYDFKGNESYPNLMFRLAFGTAKLDIDLVPASLDLVSLPNPVPSIGKLFNGTYFTRDIQSSDPDEDLYALDLNNEATFVNETLLPSGTYKVLIRALRITGDPDRPEDYDQWLSSEMTFNFTPRQSDRANTNGSEVSTDESDQVVKPIYGRPWFIAFASVLGLAVMAASIAGIAYARRRRQSAITLETAFVPPFGAYNPIVADSREQLYVPYSDTAHQGRPAHEGGRYF
ncbi:hypothetical protein PQX77_015337 [Marasmius sp. AFHP31]|nr:hypothetical protein PQX77_015337 [Marasmius sp. AFHP31]